MCQPFPDRQGTAGTCSAKAECQALGSCGEPRSGVYQEGGAWAKGGFAPRLSLLWTPRVHILDRPPGHLGFYQGLNYKARRLMTLIQAAFAMLIR